MNLRPSPIAGHWYPDDAARLSRSIDDLLERARVPAPAGSPIGLMVPHAGHRYSGAVAAQAFRVVCGRPIDTVAVLGPLHRPGPVPGAVFTTEHDAYATPLGTIPVDTEALEQIHHRLQDALGAGLVKIPFDPEHSVEIELPFLQRALAGFRLVPLMLREQTAEVARALGQALASTLVGRAALIVGSSDLSHMYPQEVAERLDRTLLARVEAFDPEGVLKADEDGLGFACGKGAIAATLWAARGLGADSVALLDYATSGAATGDYNSVVGYGSAVMSRAEG